MISERRICYLHIGTHKTGTSAIQKFVMTNADMLQTRGLFIPKFGFDEDFLLGGHANIARQFSGDVLYNPRFGSLGDLLEVMIDDELTAVLLTSELFEFWHRQPWVIKSFADAIFDAGYILKIIVYVRSRERYAESLYAQQLRHGFDCPFDEYLKYILDHGCYESTDFATCFQFEYAKIIDAFARYAGDENIIIKRYGETFGNEFVHDFLDTICYPRSARFDLDFDPVENATLPFQEALEALYANAQMYAGADGPAPAALLESIAGDDVRVGSGTFAVVDHGDMSSFSMRFASDTLSLSRRYDAHVPLVQPLTNQDARKKRRHILREAARVWGLGDYRRRCQIRFRAGMLPENIVTAPEAEAARLATEYRSKRRTLS